jgi:hypothetical protein
LPYRGLVDRKGDLFIYAGTMEQAGWIAQVLSLRGSVIEAIGLPLQARGGTNTVAPARKRRSAPRYKHDMMI